MKTKLQLADELAESVLCHLKYLVENSAIQPAPGARMLFDSLTAYKKCPPEVSARELIEELEKRHIKTFSNQVLTELEAERAKAGQQIKREVSARDVPLEEVISLLVSAGTWIRRIEERYPELSKHYPAFLDNIGEEEIRKFRKNIFAMCDFLERARADRGGAT